MYDLRFQPTMIIVVVFSISLGFCAIRLLLLPLLLLLMWYCVCTFIYIFCFLSIPLLCSTVSPHSIFLLYTLLIFIRDHKKNKIHSFFLSVLSVCHSLLPKNFSVFYAVWEFCIYALSPHWFNTNSSISFDVVLNME